MAAMYESLPAPLGAWVAYQAEVMGLPNPDSFILLLIQLEKQRQELAAIHQLLGDPAWEPAGERESACLTLHAAASLP